MSYIGSPPASQAFAPGTDTFSGTGSQTAFTLSRNVATVNDIQVVVNNVVQQPSHYTVAVNILTFSPAPSSGTNNIYVRYLSTNLITIAPQQGSVTRQALDVGSGGVGTGAAQMPVGTTSDRPATPLVGMYRMNTTTGNPEWYSSATSAWVLFSSVASYSIDYLIVAGGGAGGWQIGGGGGAGGYVTGTANVSTSTSLTVTVGAGGAGGGSGAGNNGSNSVLGSYTTAIGGGKGGDNAGNQTSGGSGGGCGEGTSPGSGTAGQGNAGGTAYDAGVNYGSGGGGGASAVGSNGTTVNGGVGGSGSTWLNGTAYAGGGGGGGYGVGSVSGGSGGGGAAGTPGNAGTNGTTNTGGGGGGGSYNTGTSTSGNGGSGGSGIVIIRYVGIQRGIGGTVTSSGGYTYHTFTTSGTFTA